MNSAVGFNFKEKIAKFYTYKSYEQYTWPIKKKKNASAGKRAKCASQTEAK